jgi:hypothetical protein
MSPDLARYLVRPLLKKHPLSWRIDFDWSTEVYDAKDRIVITFPRTQAALAQELIDFAIELAAYDAQGEADMKKLLADASIDD